MEDAPHPEIIIVRRRGGHEEEHHGGAWKIAFADFMTAMMAFFLVLWIINATDKDTKTIIARYFNPVKLEESSRTPKSIHGDGSATPAVDASDGTQSAKSKQPGPVGAAKTPDDPPPPTATSGLDKPGGNPPGAAANLGDPAAPKANMTEGVLFADPYGSLDSIAGSTSPNVLAIMQRDATNGAPANDGLPDPFRSAARQVAPETESNEPPKPPAVAAAPTPQPTEVEPTPPAAAANEAKPAPAAAESKPTAATAARLQKELELQIAPPGAARLGPAVDVKATDEGLLISLTDKMNFMMFAIGSAEPQPQLIQAMDAIAAILKPQPGLVVVRGHTDAHPYKSPTYDNWRLSSARAQMAYYMLTRAGLPESRFERIEGYADKRLRDPAHPFAAENRRIEILIKGAKP
ncbi:MAG: flagellar motor protein MotB [Roseiarcus sp.]|jgi:chemotaxis protein MotB